MKNELTNYTDGFFDPLFDFFTPDVVRDSHVARGLEMRTDVTESESAYELDVDLPGINKDDITVTLSPSRPRPTGISTRTRRARTSFTANVSPAFRAAATTSAVSKKSRSRLPSKTACFTSSFRRKSRSRSKTATGSKSSKLAC